MKLPSALALLLCLSASSAQAEPAASREWIAGELKAAAEAAGVPFEVLAAVAFVESRWTHLVPDAHDGHHARAFGAMGLRDDAWFGSSLSRAASLMGLTKSELKRSPSAAIRGGALVLADLQRRLNPSHARSRDPLAWRRAVESYPGIPGAEERQLYWKDVLRVLALGHTGTGIHLPGNPRLRQRSDTIQALRPEPTPDPEWDPSPNFTPGAVNPRYVVIHTTQGSFASSVSWLKNPRSNASAHYIIRASDGYAKQLVAETDKAWHARCWNPTTISVEHEGFVQDPDAYTEPMFKASVKLVKQVLARWRIATDDMHVFGHDFWTTDRYRQTLPADLPDCNDHTDPGIYFHWVRYLALLAQ
jgi:hypothetical protein